MFVYFTCLDSLIICHLGMGTNGEIMHISLSRVKKQFGRDKRYADFTKFYKIREIFENFRSRGESEAKQV